MAIVRAYGEMVDLLWKDGNVDGAVQLEALWNELGTHAALYAAVHLRHEQFLGRRAWFRIRRHLSPARARDPDRGLNAGG